MQVIDLSHPISPETTVYPGTEKPVFDYKEIDGYPEIKITMYTHTSTHIDVPYHILKGTKKLNDFPLSKFIGKGLVIDCRHLANKEITLDFLKPYESKIKNASYILFNAGWDKYWGKEEYFKGFPILTNEAATWLTGFKLDGIGLDSISLDKVYDVELFNHKIVLAKEILIIENMCNLSSLPEEGFMLQCLPLKIHNSDGSPVRAAGIIG